MTEPIAIVGMSCRFPKARNLDEFWQLLVNGVDAVGEIPTNRFDAEHYFNEQPATPGKIMSRWGGYLDDIEGFDASFFGIAPREAEWLDPQQRLLLEVGWEALENAGIDAAKLAGSSTGVFVGLWLSDFESRLFADPDHVDFYMTTGSGRYAASGRLSYVLGLQGPSMTVDTACSSSLVAVHLACQSLRTGECTMALAGASNVILQPQITIAYSQSRMMAPDGKCKFGDARANGYVRSEGAAVLALKLLSQAEADGDVIHGIIRGSAVNNDGQSSGYLASPGQAGQENMLRAAYANAGVSPGDVTYVEAHGTGTRAGDPIELGALGTVLAEGRTSGKKCVVGSVKTNIGHTEGAAGLAGLIKTALALKHRTLPATLHYQQPNPDIPWDQLPVEVRPELTHLPEGNQPIYAGVSAFGITGTNAHIVLQSTPMETPHESPAAKSAYVLPLSARSPEALVDTAKLYADLPADINLHDLAYTAAVHRAHHDYRLSVTAANHDNLRENLATFINGERKKGIAVSPDSPLSPRKIAFVFSGQGGQWVGMGRQLIGEEPVFRATLEQADAAMRRYTDWSLLDMLAGTGDTSRLDHIDVIQPTIFAIQIAQAALWRSWGIEPDTVIGHSMGEVAAAYVAGVLSLDDAAHVICRRSQLMMQVSGKGTMALVEMTYADAEKAITDAHAGDRLGVAVSNGPTSTVLSGDPIALKALVSQLEVKGIFCRFVNVDVAAHSPHMDALRPQLVTDLTDLQALSGAVPMISTVTGESLAGESFDAAYWGSNLRQPVRFATAVEKALDTGINTFIEMSPHPVLLTAIERGYGSREPLTTIASTRRDTDERATILEGIGQLYAAGYPVDWSQLYPEGGETLSLPTYPWQRERFWYTSTAKSTRSRGSRDGHPLLGEPLQTHDGSTYWETEIDPASLPYLADHQVRDQIMLPAAAYTEMALAAAHSTMGSAPYHLRDMAFKAVMFLTADEPTRIQVALTPDAMGQTHFEVYSKQGDNWIQHASGTLTSSAQTQPAQTLSSLNGHIGDMQSGGTHYQSMIERGLNYGTTFQGITELTHKDQVSLAQLKLDDSLKSSASAYQIHPALLDACFQLLLATLPADDRDLYLPVALDQLILFTSPASETEFRAYATQTALDTQLQGDVTLFNSNGDLLMLAHGLRMQRMDRRGTEMENRLYDIQWIATEAKSTLPSTALGDWLVFADEGGIGAALAVDLAAADANVRTVYAHETFNQVAKNFGVNPFQRADFERLLQTETAWQGIVYLWALDSKTDGLPSITYPATIGALHLAQALNASNLTPRLWLVTRNTQFEPAQASLWGFGAVLANEQADLKSVRIDLDSSTDSKTLFKALWADDGEDQIALRDGQRLAARLVSKGAPPTLESAGALQTIRAETQPFRAEVTTPGVLENLRLRALDRQSPERGQVEIEIVATGLNFMNVLSALGIYPGYPNGLGPLGIECAGRIVRVGADVTDWQVGDEVVAVAFDSLATHALTDAHLVARKPANLSFEEAATIPIVFLTAYYALHELARMQAGERVLIHAGAGGVGLAALQLVQRIGAEAWMTAGTPEKREWLTSLGATFVSDSRSLAFADDIRRATNGEGVDIVLNSLSGEAIAKGLGLLRSYGRFVEIGKRDIYDNNAVGLLPFSKSLAYFAVDLDKMSRERPVIIGRMLKEIMALVEAGELHPLPFQLFHADQLTDVFRHMAQGKHTGKIVIGIRDTEVPVFVPAKPTVHADGAYLITGGLGGIGLTVADWLAKHGAGQIILAGRRAPDANAQAHIDRLRAAGAHVETVQMDVADSASVEQTIKSIQSPLKGIFHAAGLLDDSLLPEQTADQFYNAMRPKVDGAWNLHQATLDTNLDWFVLFSSVAAVLGLPGQSNYAAGNAFMDSLAAYRHAQNLPALSINWGPWSDIGLAAAASNRGERLASRGLGSITPDEGVAVLEYLLTQTASQAVVMPFEVNRWTQTYPPAAASSLLRDLVRETPTVEVQTEAATDDLRSRISQADNVPARLAIVEAHIREQVGAVLGMAAKRVDVNKPLQAMGLDSLMTLELRNRLERGMGMKLPATLVFNYPSVAALTRHLAEELHVEDGTQPAAPTPEVPAPQTVDEFEDMTQAEIEALLADELASLDDLLGKD